jgi:hypothetical protein
MNVFSPCWRLRASPLTQGFDDLRLSCASPPWRLFLTPRTWICSPNRSQATIRHAFSKSGELQKNTVSNWASLGTSEPNSAETGNVSVRSAIETMSVAKACARYPPLERVLRPVAGSPVG